MIARFFGKLAALLRDELSDAHGLVIPAKAGIQYAAASRFNS